jgi:hypothetical protein
MLAAVAPAPQAPARRPRPLPAARRRLRPRRHRSLRSCHDAWLAPAARKDTDMNFPRCVVDLSTLKPYEVAFIEVVQKHLREVLRLRRLVRRI